MREREGSQYLGFTCSIVWTVVTSRREKCAAGSTEPHGRTSKIVYFACHRQWCRQEILSRCAHIVVTTSDGRAIVECHQRILWYYGPADSALTVAVCRPLPLRPGPMLKIASGSWECFLSTCTRMLDSISTTLFPLPPFRRSIRDRWSDKLSFWCTASYS